MDNLINQQRHRLSLRVAKNVEAKIKVVLPPTVERSSRFIYFLRFIKNTN